MKNKIIMYGLISLLLILNVSGTSFSEYGVGFDDSFWITEYTDYYAMICNHELFVLVDCDGNYDLNLIFDNCDGINVYVYDSDYNWVSQGNCLTSPCTRSIEIKYNILRLRWADNIGGNIYKTSTLNFDSSGGECKIRHTCMEGLDCNLPYVSKYNNSHSYIQTKGDEYKIFYIGHDLNYYGNITDKLDCDIVDESKEGLVYVTEYNNDYSEYQEYLYTINYTNLGDIYVQTFTPSGDYNLGAYKITVVEDSIQDFTVMLNNFSAVESTQWIINNDNITYTTGVNSSISYNFSETGGYLIRCIYQLSCDREIIHAWDVRVGGVSSVEGYIYEQLSDYSWFYIQQADIEYLSHDTGNSFYSESDVNGYYFFDNIPLGTYEVYVTRAPYAIHHSNFTIAVVDHTSYYSIRMYPAIMNGEITSYLYDINNNALSNFSFRLEGLDHVNWFTLVEYDNNVIISRYLEYNVTYADNWISVFNLSEGEYRITVEKDNYVDWIDGINASIAYFTIPPQYWSIYNIMKNVSELSTYNLTVNLSCNQIGKIMLYDKIGYNDYDLINVTVTSTNSTFYDLREGIYKVIVSGYGYEDYENIFYLDKNEVYNVCMEDSEEYISYTFILEDRYSYISLNGRIEVTDLNNISNSYICNGDCIIPLLKNTEYQITFTSPGYHDYIKDYLNYGNKDDIETIYLYLLDNYHYLEFHFSSPNATCNDIIPVTITLMDNQKNILATELMEDQCYTTFLQAHLSKYLISAENSEYGIYDSTLQEIIDYREITCNDYKCTYLIVLREKSFNIIVTQEQFFRYFTTYGWIGLILIIGGFGLLVILTILKEIKG